MKKRIFALCLTVCIALSLMIETAYADGKLMVSCDSKELSPGDKVEVSVSVDSCSGIAGYLIYVNCDTDVFVAEVDESDGSYLVRKGEFSESGTQITNVNGTDGWQVLWFSTSNEQGSGELFTITLIVADDAKAGNYPISVGYSEDNTVDENSEEVELIASSTSVTVLGGVSGSTEDGSTEDDTTSDEGSESDKEDSEGVDKKPDEEDGLIKDESDAGEKEPEKTEEQTENDDGNKTKVNSEQAVFSDVPKDNWAHSYIMELFNRGIVSGKGNGVFAPNDNVTRAEFVKMLAGIASADTVGMTTDKFRDVKADDWFMPYVSWAVECEIVQGISETEFGPTELLTREQMAALIARLCGMLDVQLVPVEDAKVFVDEADISEYAKAAIMSVQQAGIISGYPDGTFMAGGNAKRCEAAKVLATVLDLIESYRIELN